MSRGLHFSRHSIYLCIYTASRLPMHDVRKYVIIKTADLGCVNIACLKASRDKSSSSKEKYYQNSSVTCSI